MVQKLRTAVTGKQIIGLTGSFGSGKTTVAHLFEELGAQVLDADTIAHEVLIPGGPHYDEVAALFQDVDLGTSGALDRRKVAAMIFNDPDRRKRLEAVVHPYVLQRLAEEIYQAQEKMIVVEVPLLFETGLHRFCDQTVLVTASEEVITSRLRKMGFSLQEIEVRRRVQMPVEEKKKQADMIVDNSGELEETKREVEQIWRKLHAPLKGER